VVGPTGGKGILFLV